MRHLREDRLHFFTIINVWNLRGYGHPEGGGACMGGRGGLHPPIGGGKGGGGRIGIIIGPGWKGLGGGGIRTTPGGGGGGYKG